MNDTKIFEFERDFAGSLRCIPMAVRFKLDLCGIKLTLRQWSQFSPGDRTELLDLPCATTDELQAFYARLVELIETKADEPVKPLPPSRDTPWNDVLHVPEQVYEFALTQRVDPPTVVQWAQLMELQRYSLVKLTRSNHDNLNFVPALHEFGLL